MRTVRAISLAIASIGLLAAMSIGVPAQIAALKPKEIFIDAGGNRLTNNEFVDLRLANRTGNDPATRTVLEDGTVEFRILNPAQEGTPAPSFEAFDVDGKWFDMDELKGKVVVLNFWFIGCLGCMSEIPKLDALAGKFKDNADVAFVAVSTNTPQELRAFREREKFGYRHIGRAQSVIDQFNFAGFPRNIVVGRDGKIVYWRSTIHAWDKFESVIRSELAKS